MNWMSALNRGLWDLRDNNLPPTGVSSMLTTQAWPIHKKKINTLGLYMALVQLYDFGMGKTWEKNQID